MSTITREVIPLADKQGNEFPLVAQRFDSVYDAIRGGTHKKMRWVRSRARPGDIVPFDASFTGLFSWARHEGLLHGQRARLLDKALVRMRNLAAHRSSFHRTGPPNAARLICDVAEVINRLWGALTPGGHLYPAPIRRDIFGIGWNSDGTHVARPWADQLADDFERPDWRYIVVRAVEADDVWGFHADFETTRYPADFLWGPGSASAARAWLDHYQPMPDDVQYLDRWFVLRVRDQNIDPPRNVDQLAGLPQSERDGIWLLIRADYPLDAYAHARSLSTSPPVGECPRSGPCDHCGVDLKATGDWATIRQLSERLGLKVTPKELTGIRVESEVGRWPYP